MQSGSLCFQTDTETRTMLDYLRLIQLHFIYLRRNKAVTRFLRRRECARNAVICLFCQNKILQRSNKLAFVFNFAAAFLAEHTIKHIIIRNKPEHRAAAAKADTNLLNGFIILHSSEHLLNQCCIPHFVQVRHCRFRPVKQSFNKTMLRSESAHPFGHFNADAAEREFLQNAFQQ